MLTKEDFYFYKLLYMILLSVLVLIKGSTLYDFIVEYFSETLDCRV